MKLKASHNSARERITEMIVSGNILLEKITGEYAAAKKAGTFAEEKYIPGWKDQYIDWLHKCLAASQEIFPTPLEAIRLKNAQPPSSYQKGVDVKWTGLTNDIRAKLSALDKSINSVNEYSVEMTDELFIEDLDSFAKARDINPREVKPLLPLKLSEQQIKTFLEEIIGEHFGQHVGSEETTGVITSHIKVGGDRLRAAFLLKGSGTKGKLTITKCGKKGDQIVRLVEAPADIYVIQHVDAIDERVIRNLHGKIQLMNNEGKNCRMCIVDGPDTARILLAYGKIER